MKILVKKMSSFGILRVQMVVGTLLMAAAMVALPIGLVQVDPALLLNPYILGAVVVCALVFGALAYLLFIRPYLLYRKLPEVLAEADGEYVCFYGKKQAKIPLSAFAGAMVTYHLPFLYSNELIATLLVHLLSEKYGDLSVDVPGHGCYKLHFVSKVTETAEALLAFLSEAQEPTDR